MIKLGNPRRDLVSGVYLLCVTGFERNGEDFTYWVEDAKGIEYPFQSKRFLKVGCAYFFKVNVSVTSSGILKIDIIRKVGLNNQSKKQKGRNEGNTYKQTTGYRQQNWEPTIYKGGGHLIYTRM